MRAILIICCCTILGACAVPIPKYTEQPAISVSGNVEKSKIEDSTVLYVVPTANTIMALDYLVENEKSTSSNDAVSLLRRAEGPDYIVYALAENFKERFNKVIYLKSADEFIPNENSLLVLLDLKLQKLHLTNGFEEKAYVGGILYDGSKNPIKRMSGSAAGNQSGTLASNIDLSVRVQGKAVRDFFSALDTAFNDARLTREGNASTTEIRKEPALNNRESCFKAALGVSDPVLRQQLIAACG